jgi:UDP-N-acetylglucosamine--N-acetylmuramyl-(pentapeptide) pyrophosphoryl-undecaprenol N-acetylglucosamine transferase
MRVIFAGGGSGGHIFPAIAIADEIKKMDSSNQILFIGAKGRLEERLVPQNGYNIELINISGLSRESFRKNIMLPVRFLVALRKCRQVFRQFKPDVVVGTGGFVSGPVVITASRMKIPFLVQEGNAFPGKVTKAASRKARKVVVTFEDSAHYLKRKDNIIKISHPIRYSLNRIDRAEAVNKFGLNAANKTVFIFGGSQGARGINIAVDKIAAELYKENINIIWQTGQSDYESISRRYAGSDKIKIFQFIDDMSAAYSAADLVICRAGMTSIMEMAYLKSAALLIPLPTAAENHQEMNARNLEMQGAALVLLQPELGEKLYNTVTNAVNNPEVLGSLAENISKYADPGAAKKIAEEVYKIIN